MAGIAGWPPLCAMLPEVMSAVVGLFGGAIPSRRRAMRALFAATILAGGWALCAPRVAAASDDGYLDIASEPAGARIWIDQRDTGRVTPFHALPVKAGHHQLLLVTADGSHRPLSVGFSVEAGQTQKLTLHLQAK